MTDPTSEINKAFDGARKAERDVRDEAIDDEVAQTDRIAAALANTDTEPRK